MATRVTKVTPIGEDKKISDIEAGDTFYGTASQYLLLKTDEGRVVEMNTGIECNFGADYIPDYVPVDIEIRVKPR